MTQTQKEKWLVKHRELWTDIHALGIKASEEKIYSPKASTSDVRSSIRAHIHRIEKAELARKK